MMGVPRFYMNVRYRDRLFVDEEGDGLPPVEWLSRSLRGLRWSALRFGG
jgi:hypothetical protein